MATWPTMTFQADWAHGPNDGVRTWTSLQSAGNVIVDTFKISRGRQYELDKVEAGTCTITAQDLSEYLNPANTSSPWNAGTGATRTNLCTNPSFEVSTAGWTAENGATIAASATYSWIGSNSAAITWGTGAGGGIGSAGDVYYTLPQSIGQTYTFSAYVYVPAGVPAVRLAIITGGSAGHHTVYVIGIHNNVRLSGNSFDM